jgi:hypothetical protein
MKTLKYILILILAAGTFHSCLVDDETKYDLNDAGLNLVTFERINANLTMTATGEEKTFKVKVKLVGPTSMNVTNDISVTVTPDGSSTAIEGDHYRIDNLPIVLSPSNNFLAELEITLMSEGNAAPMDGTPEFDSFVAPVLKLNLVATGDPKVVGSGKVGTFTLNFVPPNPYAGDYISHIIYRHPAYGVYPDNIYVEEDNEKTLAAVTGRKCETGFAIWFDTDLCWITVNANNSIKFEVGDTWPYEVKLGDPNDPSKVSHFDPATGQIYLYYHYVNTTDGLPRIFWEVFTPVE